MKTWQTIWLMWCCFWLVVWLTVGWLLFPINLIMAFASFGAMIVCAVPPASPQSPNGNDLNGNSNTR